MPEASVIISTYNRPAHLERCLEHFRHQTELDFEVVVADDGSGEETAEVIRAAARDYPVPLHHAWQEDQGYRLAAVRSHGVRFATADYLIPTDSDCIPRFLGRSAKAQSILSPFLPHGDCQPWRFRHVQTKKAARKANPNRQEHLQAHQEVPA